MNRKGTPHRMRRRRAAGADPMSPEAQAAFFGKLIQERVPANRPERRVFAAVLVQAIIDAGRDRRGARDWLQSDEAVFVVHMAGIDEGWWRSKVERWMVHLADAERSAA